LDVLLLEAWAWQADGLWIVTAAGLVGAGAAAWLIHLGPSGARNELIKLQTTIAEVTLTYGKKTDATGFVGTLLSERDEIRLKRDQALERNEGDAQVVKDFSEIEDSLSDAIRWINDRLTSA
jgi:hypothetical protein